MFEVVEIGPLEKKRLLRRQRRQIKLRCLSTTFCEKLGRSFEGHGRYTTQTYRADFSEGETVIFVMTGTPLWAVGDQLGIESLAATFA
jgi:hypothetical protein